MAFSFGGNATTTAGASASATTAFGGFGSGSGSGSASGFGTALPAGTSAGAGGFAGFSASTSTAANTTTTANAHPPVAFYMPKFDDTFANWSAWQQISKLCQTTGNASAGSGAGSGASRNTTTSTGTTGSTTGTGSSTHRDEDFNNHTLQGQELVHVVTQKHRTALQPKLSAWSPPNVQLRQQLLQQNRTIGILVNDHDHNATTQEKTTVTTTLTLPVLEKILQLSDDLRIPEDQAACLYAYIAGSEGRAAALSTGSHGSSSSSPLDVAGYSVPTSSSPTTTEDKLARDFYFYERQLGLETLLLLVQSRLQQPQYILQATDVLLQEDALIPALLVFLQGVTQRILELQQEVAALQVSATATGNNSMSYPSVSQTQTTPVVSFAQVHLCFYQQQQQTASEILLFLAYHTQFESAEIVQLLDQIRDLTAHVPAPCPFTNVPSPFEANGNYNHHHYSNYQSLQLLQKPFSKWQLELVAHARESGQPAIWQCLSLLVVTALAALDTQQVLYCRNKHALQDYTGNALLSSSSSSMVVLQPIHDRLAPGQVEERWPRPDVGALLTSAYVLLLLQSSLSSSSSSAEAPYVQAAREGTSTPADFQSFTLLRLQIIPSLQRLSSSSGSKSTKYHNCHGAAEFALAVVTEHVAHYLQSLDQGGQQPSHQQHQPHHQHLLPLSRHKWIVEEEEQLQLRRDAAARDQQFHSWQHGGAGVGFGDGFSTFSNNTNTMPAAADQEVIPTSVDLMTRPDCLDDLVAVATDLCALGPDYARIFLPQGRPCSTLLELHHHVVHRADNANNNNTDTSLLPCYLSWLAALANDQESAMVIYQLLNKNGASTSNTTSTPNNRTADLAPDRDAGASTNRPSSATFDNGNGIDWHTIIYNLQWYAQELNPYDMGANKAAGGTSSSTASNEANNSNSSYYYNLEGDFVQDRGTTSATTSSFSSQANGGGANSSGEPNSNSSNKTKELSETSMFHLASHLAILRNVAQHSPKARCDLLKIVLPIVGNNSISVMRGGGDETLLILFKLAIAPLPPTLRGATLATIASLLLPPPSSSDDGLLLLSKEEKTFLLEQAKHGWEYLETCPLLPISLCDQYRVLNADGDHRNSPPVVGLAFPRSSLALANAESTNNNNDNLCLLPKDPSYGLFYELEYVESQLGWYPSTEGCLELLRSLVMATGCPSTLGQNWRLRTGVAPYLEYVTGLVLPRVLGSTQQGGSTCSKLYFRVPGDQSRLATKALAVLEAILTRYSVPSTKALQILHKKPERTATATTTVAEAESLFGIPTIAEQAIGIAISTAGAESSEIEWVNDFHNRPVSTSAYASAAQQSSSVDAAAMTMTPASSLPRAKSPGFCIMADILSFSGGSFFEALALILAGHGGAGGIQSIFGAQGDDMALAYAMYGATVPNLTSAREGAKEGEPTKPMETLLKPLLPRIHDFTLDATGNFDDGVLWRERSIEVALRILCAVAAREESFFLAVANSPEPLKMVPALRFQAIRYGSSNLKVMNVSPSRLSHLLYTTTNSQFVRAAIVEYIGHKASNDELDAQLSGTALSLSHFLYHKMLATSQGVRGWVGQSKALLSRVIADRLLLSSRRQEYVLDYQSTSLILNWILTDLRAGVAIDGGLVQILMGLPSRTEGGNWSPDRPHYGGILEDCFDAILELLREMDYASLSREQSEIVSSCLEIIFRLYNLIGTTGELRVVVYTAQRLRSVDFWPTNLLLWLSSRGTEPLARACSEDLAQFNPQTIHAMAWLLKGLACELNLLVGFAGHSVWDTDSVLAGFISPRPALCRGLLELMFASGEPLVLKLLGSLPLDTVSMNPELNQPPGDALRAGVSNWPGPSDVASGYCHVDKTKALKFIQSSGSVHGADLEDWVDEWNSLVARNCAASHLSSSVAMMLDVATAANASFQSTGVDRFPTCFSPNNLMELTFGIMERLLERTKAGRIASGMDANLYTNASRNMGNAVLLLVEMITSMDKSQWPSGSEFLYLTSLISQAIAYSGIGDDSDAETPTRHERTTVLGNALSLVLGATAQVEPDLLLRCRDDLLLAGKALARLSTIELSGASPESNSVVSILARSSVSTMIRTCSNREDNKGGSFCFQLLSQDLVSSFMGLVSRLDVNICSLLQTIANQPYGGEIMINGRLFEAMEMAARSYAKEEADMVAKIGAGVGGFRQVKIMSPDFLMGHLNLLNTALECSTVSSQHRQGLPVHAMEILRHYKGTFQRLCFNFPFEGDILRAFLRCFLESTCRASPTDPSERYNELKPTFQQSFSDLFSEAGFFESGILILCEQLLEFPMPKGLLPPPPQSLEHRKTAAPLTGPVKVDSDKQGSWWDVLELLLATNETTSRFSFKAPIGSGDFGYWGSQKPTQWTENKFEYAIVAADVLSLGLSLLKKQDRLQELEGSTVARGLHQFILASQSIQRRLDEVCLNGVGLSSIHMDTGSNDPPNNDNPELEAEYLALFGASVAHCVEELLVIAYRALIYSGSKENGPNDPLTFTRQLQIAIQQSGLESTGLGCLHRMKDGAERIELVKFLAKQIALSAD